MSRAHADRWHGVRRRGAAARDETRTAWRWARSVVDGLSSRRSRLTVTGRFAAGAGRLADGSV